MNDPFWSPRIRLLVQATLPQQFEQMVTTGRIRNFERVAKGELGGHDGYYYNDSDVYKWVEACGYGLHLEPNQDLERNLTQVIDAICASVDSDGYINTFFQLNHPDLKFRNLSYMHEMYCMGHLIEAGIALQEFGQDKRLFEVAIRVANLLVERFGESGELGMCGHQEIEIALFRLAEATGDNRYSNLAARMINGRGQKPSRFDIEREDRVAMALSPWERNYLNLRGEYFQDHAPIREHRIVVGHAVRSMYMYRAACYMAQGDDELETALRALWENMSTKRMYVTGGIGSTAKNEGFSRDYDLPNLNSYAETCAAVGLIFWGCEMTRFTGESDFIDVIERALFNGAISGISADGKAYFYANPLESQFNHSRSPWFECACCPPNIARMIGSVSSLAYSVSEDLKSYWMHFPIAGTISDQNGPIFEIESNYPVETTFTIRYVGSNVIQRKLYVRIPEWSEEATFECQPNPHEAGFENGYAVFDRKWTAGDTVLVEWSAEPQWLSAHPSALDCVGKVALVNGPIVYCLESVDAEFPAQHFLVDNEQEVEVVKLRAKVKGASLVQASTDEPLYSEYRERPYEESEVEMIPYFDWGNCGPSTMAVWLPTLTN